jgi:hypothetical protein
MTTLQSNWLPFYRRWIWANGWSELVGLGCTALLWWALNRVLGERPSAALTIIGALVSIAAGTLCEGVLVGYAQGAVLRERLPSLPIRRWIRATAIGACMAWVLGTIPSTVAALSESSGAATPPPFEGPLVYVVAAGMGFALGMILGLPQWLQLRAYARRSLWWMAANSVAWAAGMAIIFAGAGATPANTPVVAVVAVIAAACLSAGLIVGATHGLILIWILKSATQTTPQASEYTGENESANAERRDLLL